MMACLANRVAILSREVEQCRERFARKMRLIAQRNDPMGDGFFPAAPLGGTFYGAEHSTSRVLVDDPVLSWKTKPVQLAVQSLILRCADHARLRGPGLPPELQQVPDDRRRSPRQQQLRLSHPGRGARSQQDGGERNHEACMPFARRCTGRAGLLTGIPDAEKGVVSKSMGQAPAGVPAPESIPHATDCSSGTRTWWRQNVISCMTRIKVTVLPSAVTFCG